MRPNNNILQPGHLLRSPNYSYRIERVLGVGGFGITYLASATVKVGNVSVRVNFAIKEHFMSNDCERDPDTSSVIYSNPAKERVESSRKDFISEANRLRKVGINHDNIVKVNEVFEANNTAYYVMEYLDGESLRKYVKRKGNLSEDKMLSIMTPLVNAVNYLHQNRMTHLDIKPDNIMIVHDENGQIYPVLIDFGLSKHYDKEGNPTSTINILGCSDGYAPIEQYAGITTFSPTADIYSLGATMWFCLTGTDPKKSTDLLEGNLSRSLPDNISDYVKNIIASSTTASKFDRKIVINKKNAVVRDDAHKDGVVRECVYGPPSPWSMLNGNLNPTSLLEGVDKRDFWKQRFDKYKVLVFIFIGLSIIGIICIKGCGSSVIAEMPQDDSIYEVEELLELVDTVDNVGIEGVDNYKDNNLTKSSAQPKQPSQSSAQPQQSQHSVSVQVTQAYLDQLRDTYNLISTVNRFILNAQQRRHFTSAEANTLRDFQERAKVLNSKSDVKGLNANQQKVLKQINNVAIKARKALGTYKIYDEQPFTPQQPQQLREDGSEKNEHLTPEKRRSIG